MAYLVEEHYNQNAGSIIPEYWQPDNAPHTMPCATQQEAESMEEQLATE